MSFLKLRNPNQLNLLNQIQGQQIGNDRIEMVEDAEGNFFIHSGIKNAEVFSHLLPLFNQLEEVVNISFKVYEI